MPPSIVNDRLLRGSDFSVGKSSQTTKGAINSNPTFIPMRRTTGKPKRTVGYVQDESVTTDNQGQQNIQDTNEYSMELQSSFSKQSVALLLETIHGTETAFTNTGTTYETTATGLVLAAAAYAAISAGDAFFVSGFTDPLNDGLYIIVSKDGSNTVTTTVAPNSVEGAGDTITFTSNKTTNGLTPTYSALQERVSSSGGTLYHTFYDAVPDTQSIEIGETGIVTTTVNFMIEKKVSGESAISGQTYAAALTDRSVSASQDVTNWYVDGVLATCVQKSMTVEVANGYSGDDASACARQYARGQFAVTGSAAMRALFSDPLQWREYYEDGTRKALGVHITHPGGGNTFIYMPQCAITEHDQANGSNDIANHEISFGAEGHPTLGYTIAVFRDWV